VKKKVRTARGEVRGKTEKYQKPSDPKGFSQVINMHRITIMLYALRIGYAAYEQTSH
jgi:hypothetical protein